MKKGIVVLSLFDGMSCGRIALERAGIKVEKYYASEIDKYAITVTQANYPNTIQLGSITEWQKWEIEKPDIIIGGSPCQGFSFAGKGLNFNDERSKLFFTFVDILKHYKPKYFLLENVRMKKEYQKVISNCLGVEPIEINSALVSAQNRRRLYWTNIQGITQPEDKGIVLRDIIEDATTEKEKSYCIDANYHKGSSPENYIDKSRRQMVKVARMVGRKIDENGTRKDNCLVIGKADLNGHDICKRVYSVGHKSPTAPTGTSGNTIPKIAVVHTNISGTQTLHYDKTCALRAGASANYQQVTGFATWRKLTPVECERLQTVPDNYTNYVSNSQRYKMLGNGWTVDVIAHILRGIK